jgi:putative Mg2+ transporter-C (MgtC) family protein
MEESMPLTLTWHEIALRLALSALAGTVVGLDRGEHGHAAGLRTTLLVCLAAAVAMIQANLLLPTIGKTSDSFGTLDLMRLPLGILTGMGFIGGGAILRRESLVTGVTTAATLWFVTVIGLCFGGGQIALGLASLGLGLLVLTGLRWFDYHMRVERRGTLSLTTEDEQSAEEEICAAARKSGYKIYVSSVTYGQTGQQIFEFALQWRGRPQTGDVPPFLKELAQSGRVSSLQWKLS